jgi:hypothetical protein
VRRVMRRRALSTNVTCFRSVCSQMGREARYSGHRVGEGTGARVGKRGEMEARITILLGS